MKKNDFLDLLDILACPRCYGGLVAAGIEGGDRVVSGTLACGRCGAVYPVRRSVIYLIVPDASWKCVLQEVASWKSYEREQEFLKHTGLIDEGKTTVEDYTVKFIETREERFREIIARHHPDEGTWACEVGAFECKQALYLTGKNIRVAATDAWPEPMVLGSGPECGDVPKICCHAERLPFKSGSFPLTYVRTSLHHFERLYPAIREISRITRRGGRVMIINEPSNYLWARPSHQRRSDLAFLLGMNEQDPHFWAFLFGLFGAGLKMLDLRYYDPAPPPIVRSLFPRMGIDVARLMSDHYRSGAQVRGIALLKLLFVHCDISVVAEKGSRRIPVPPPVPPERLCFTIEEFLDRGLENLTSLWKRTLRPAEVMRSIVVGENDGFHLRRGWEKRERIFGGWTRWTRHIAYVFLRRGAADRVFEMDCRAPVLARGSPLRIEVSIEGGPWAPCVLDGDTPARRVFPLPEETGEIVEVRIRTPKPWKGADVYPGKYDPRLYFGVAVSGLRLR